LFALLLHTLLSPWCQLTSPPKPHSKLFHFLLGKGASYGKPAGCILDHNQQDVMASVVRIKKGSWMQGPAGGTRLQAQQDPLQQQEFRQPEFKVGEASSREYVTIR
jgi:hypothetical protein